MGFSLITLFKRSQKRKTSCARPIGARPYPNQQLFFFSGSYLYFSNFMKRKGTKAHVVSEAIISGLQATDCMDFWYIVAGDEDTKLRVS